MEQGTFLGRDRARDPAGGMGVGNEASRAFPKEEIPWKEAIGLLPDTTNIGQFFVDGA